MRYVIGLDIGVGSVGWAAVSCDERKRILDFGVRIYESGEESGGKDRTSQARRRFRSMRRQIRRRAHRKARIKAHLENIGLVAASEAEEYLRTGSHNVIDIRVKGLDSKLTPTETAACLLYFCNHRGYRDFYEEDTSLMTAEERKAYEEEKSGAAAIDSRMRTGQYRTVAEMIQQDAYFEGTGAFRSYRNSRFRAEQLRINREYLVKECEMILKTQQTYYPAILTDRNIQTASDIIFNQRMFEDGPGYGVKETAYRRYAGFLDTFGKCRFFPDEARGCRFTALADIYSLVNALSQFRYYDKAGQKGLPSALAAEMVRQALVNGSLTKANVKSLAKKHGIEVEMTEVGKSEPFSSSLRYIKTIKPLFEQCGLDWQAAISEDLFDMNSLLNRLGVCLSQNITPRRRREALKKVEGIPAELAEKLVGKKFSGTCHVSDKYMRGAVEAFLEGDVYGDYQADFIRKQENDAPDHPRSVKLPPFDKDFEFIKNPVVCRAINETRKVVNAIIGKYGSPYAINIEVASDLNRSFDDRMEIQKRQKSNEKETARVKKAIAQLLAIDEAEVTVPQIERYFLGEQQGWKCMYSGRDIDAADCLRNQYKQFEVDHIMPYSLILDNTRHNKALVYADENQRKGQRTPLMYLSGQRADDFIGRVNALYQSNKISRRKYDYLMQRTLDSELVSEWKSRNLNDTRYISKFLVRYFKENLVFCHEEEERYRRTEVYAVKAAITSQLRRLWLNEATWGTYDKADLKKETYLDHAADAVVIACCIPAYVEIASVQNKLSRLYKRNKYEDEEYKAVMEDCLRSMKQYYGLERGEVAPLLRRRDKTPCLIDNLREEVDIRFIEPHTYRLFHPEETVTDDEIAALFHTKCAEFYADDPAFAASLTPVITSHKQEKSVAGAITREQPVSVVRVDGVPHEVTRKAATDITKKQIAQIYSGDPRLTETLCELMKDRDEKDTVGQALAARGETCLVLPDGQTVNRVRLLETKTFGGKILDKTIADGGHTLLNAQNYYCIELYRNKKKKLKLRGIHYADLVKSDGKLWLAEHCVTPEDYASHEMYLYKWDYVEVIDKDGKSKFQGYVVGSAGLSQSKLYKAYANTPAQDKKDLLSVAQTDTFIKYDIDLLGKKGGEIRCGEPLLSITEKK